MYRYCGPYWSDGKWQSSVKGGQPGENELDEVCRVHDSEWWELNNGLRTDYDQIDDKFIESASRHGVAGWAMAKAVGINKAIRGFTAPAGDNMTKSNGNLRKGKTVQKVQPKLRGSTPSTPVRQIGETQLSAPAAISSVFTSQPTSTRSISKGIVASGKEFVGSVRTSGTGNTGLGKSALLSPCFFYGGVLGNLARCYSRYKFTKITLHYIPRVSTTTNGQIVMCTNSNITLPALQSEGTASFYQRALVSGNGVMAPVWTPVRMKVTTDSKIRYVDALTNTDIDENVLCELQVYSQSDVNGTVGHIWMEYECELTEMRLEPHSTLLPVQLGPGSRATLVADSATPTANNAVVLVEGVGSTLGLTGYGQGTIFRMVLDLTMTIAPTGSTYDNAWKIVTTRTSNSILGVVASNDAIVGGMTLYLCVYNSTLLVYTSIEQAVTGSGSGQFMWRTSGTSTGQFVGDLTMVRISNEAINDTQ